MLASGWPPTLPGAPPRAFMHHGTAAASPEYAASAALYEAQCRQAAELRLLESELAARALGPWDVASALRSAAALEHEASRLRQAAGGAAATRQQPPPQRTVLAAAYPAACEPAARPVCFATAPQMAAPGAYGAAAGPAVGAAWPPAAPVATPTPVAPPVLGGGHVAANAMAEERCSPQWATEIMRAETLVERKRRFQGRLFRLWVEDCVLRGGIRVHAMDTASLAETHLELGDAVVQQMFDAYWERARRLRLAVGDSRGGDAEHGEEIREFLDCLLDAAYFELSQDGQELALRVPPVVEPRPPQETPGLRTWRDPPEQPQLEEEPLTTTWIRQNILTPRQPRHRPSSARPKERCTRSSSARPAGRVVQAAGGQSWQGSTCRSRPMSAAAPRPQSARSAVSMFSRPGDGLPATAARGPRPEDAKPGPPAGPRLGAPRRPRPASAQGPRGEEPAAMQPRPPAAPRRPGTAPFPRAWGADTGCAAEEPVAPERFACGGAVAAARQRRPASAKASKHKRVPENNDGPTIYEDHEPSIADGDSEHDDGFASAHTSEMIYAPAAAEEGAEGDSDGEGYEHLDLGGGYAMVGEPMATARWQERPRQEVGCRSALRGEGAPTRRAQWVPVGGGEPTLLLEAVPQDMAGQAYGAESRWTTAPRWGPPAFSEPYAAEPCGAPPRMPSNTQIVVEPHRSTPPRRSRSIGRV